MEELDIAIKASIESGKILQKYFRKTLKPEWKADQSPVTIADKESERKITSIIKDYFPEHNILGEEYSYKETDSEYKWIIDPLDMTRNFIRHIPFYSNFIALEKKGKVIMGVINMPEIKTMAYASIGKGTFVNGKRAKVSNIKKLEDSYILNGDVNEKGTEPYTKEIFTLINKCKYNRGYADGLGYIFLVQGHADIVIDRPKPWDIAPAKIIVEEAGGKVTDFKGKDTIYEDNSIATNKILHDEAIRILADK
jgi:histidinol-phosphatase